MRKQLATLVLFLVLAPAGPAFAGSKDIRELSILVLDPRTKETLAEVSPGGTLTLEVGERVRLRMRATPYDHHLGPRFPSTRFWLSSGKGRLRVHRVNKEIGSITLEAIRADPAQRRHERTVVRFEILSHREHMDSKMLRGSVNIEVEGPVRSEPPPERGVVLYSEPGFRGHSETFYHDHPRLADHSIRDNSVSSVRVAPGCEAVLYEGPGYNGRRVRVTRDVEDLGNTDLGTRAASSIQVQCQGHSSERRGVTLFADGNFRGRQEKFYASDPDLGDHAIGNDSVSSLRVDPGCRATLFTESGYRGRSYVVTGDVYDISRTPVGNDSVSSLHVECSNY